MTPQQSTATTPPLVAPGRHAFYLDFDGTLAPIAARPQDAALAPDTRQLLARLIERAEGAVAILTGRPLADIDRLTAPLRLAASGAHGVEIRDAAGKLREVRPPDMSDMAQAIAGFADENGLIAEHKPGNVALHYRSAPHLEDASRRLVDDLAASGGHLRAIHGKMVSEVACNTVSKGTALLTLSETAPFAGRIPVMIGDDVTDEDGIRSAQDAGGFGVRIGPGDSAARFRFDEMAQFHHWLARITGAGDADTATVTEG